MFRSDDVSVLYNSLSCTVPYKPC